jgi:dolichyl-phosphate-mannose--protein O-mannosyl transferase
MLICASWLPSITMGISYSYIYLAQTAGVLFISGFVWQKFCTSPAKWIKELDLLGQPGKQKLGGTAVVCGGRYVKRFIGYLPIPFTGKVSEESLSLGSLLIILTASLSRTPNSTISISPRLELCSTMLLTVRD